MDWELYTEQLGFYFLANGITEAKTKKAVLLTNLSVETYQLAKNLVAPTQLKDDAITYTVIEERMQKQLKPESQTVNRFTLQGFKPLKSEAIHETGLSGNVVTSFFPLIIFIYVIFFLNNECFLTVLRFNLISLSLVPARKQFIG